MSWSEKIQDRIINSRPLQMLRSRAPRTYRLMHLLITEPGSGHVLRALHKRRLDPSYSDLDETTSVDPPIVFGEQGGIRVYEICPLQLPKQQDVWRSIVPYLKQKDDDITFIHYDTPLYQSVETRNLTTIGYFLLDHGTHRDWQVWAEEVIKNEYSQEEAIDHAVAVTDASITAGHLNEAIDRDLYQQAFFNTYHTIGKLIGGNQKIEHPSYHLLVEHRHGKTGQGLDWIQTDCSVDEIQAQLDEAIPKRAQSRR